MPNLANLSILSGRLNKASLAQFCNLKNLKQLSFDETEIEMDLTPAFDNLCTLERLTFFHERSMRRIGSQEGKLPNFPVNLIYLYVKGIFPLVDVSEVSRCKSLTSLVLRGVSDVRDISMVGELKHLTSLIVKYVRVLDISPIANCQELTNLRIRFTAHSGYGRRIPGSRAVQGLETLRRLKKLEWLTIEDRKCRDEKERYPPIADELDNNKAEPRNGAAIEDYIFDLAKLLGNREGEVAKLAELEVRFLYSRVVLREISEFSFPYLKQVSVEYLEAGSDLGVFKNLENLEELYVAGFDLRNLRSLMDLKKLKELTVLNDVSLDVSSLANHPSLVEVQFNQVINLISLLSIPNLGSVSLTEADWETSEDLRKQKPGLRVYQTYKHDN